MRIKRNISIIILLCMIIALPASASSTLKDIDNHWAKKSIERLLDNSITTGYPDGSYKPEQSVNVIEFIAFTIRALGLNVEVAQTGYWGQNYIDKALEIKLIDKDQFDSFDRPIKREEMAAIITKALEYKGEILLADTSLKDKIDDFDQITYVDEVLKAYNTGVITGYPDGRFIPEGNATRAEAATVIIRLMDYNTVTVEETKEEEQPLVGSQAPSKDAHVNETIGPNSDWVSFAQEHKYDLTQNWALEMSTVDEDGKINYNDEETTGETISEENIPNLNNIINNLLSLFVQEDYYTHFKYYPTYKEVTIDYAKGLNGVMQSNSYIAYAFYTGEKHDLTKYSIEGEHDYSQLSDNVTIELELNYLFSSKYMPTEEEDKKGIYYHDFYANQLKESLIIVFGEEKAEKIYDLVMSEYKLYAYDKQTYPNDATTYYIDNLRIDVTHYLKSRPLKFSFTFQ